MREKFEQEFATEIQESQKIKKRSSKTTTGPKKKQKKNLIVTQVLELPESKIQNDTIRYNT
jgi:hypothetical protein